MTNPFRDRAQFDPTDEQLLEQARAGNQARLEDLIARYQPWIYNTALRMLGRPADADDATQDILLKTVKGLPAFRGESAFSTWIYRIVANHLLDVRRQQWKSEEAICSFDVAAVGLSQTPDLELPDPRTLPVPLDILVEEVKLSCSLGTLLCLDGRQRLAFVLGELFGVSDQVGAEILDVTPANFRQILSRARRDLYAYLNGHCSLVNPGAACRCARKTQAFIGAGFVDPSRLTFTSGYRQRVRDVAGDRMQELLDAWEKTGADVYRGHPFYEPSEQVARLRSVLDGTSLSLSA